MHLFMCLRELNKRLQKKTSLAEDVLTACKNCEHIIESGIVGFEHRELVALEKDGKPVALDEVSKPLRCPDTIVCVSLPFLYSLCHLEHVTATKANRNALSSLTPTLT